jgi:hypothetical protein
VVDSFDSSCVLGWFDSCGLFHPLGKSVTDPRPSG